MSQAKSFPRRLSSGRCYGRFSSLETITHADGDGSHLDFELDAEDDMVRLYSIVLF